MFILPMIQLSKYTQEKLNNLLNDSNLSKIPHLQRILNNILVKFDMILPLYYGNLNIINI